MSAALLLETNVVAVRIMAASILTLKSDLSFEAYVNVAVIVYFGAVISMRLRRSASFLTSPWYSLISSCVMLILIIPACLDLETDIAASCIIVRSFVRIIVIFVLSLKLSSNSLPASVIFTMSVAIRSGILAVATELSLMTMNWSWISLSGIVVALT